LSKAERITVVVVAAAMVLVFAMAVWSGHRELDRSQAYWNSHRAEVKR
jgi:hypothetical protein